jgi:hypothetical protein
VTLLLLLACTAETPPADDTAPVDDGLHGRLAQQGGRDVLYLWGTREEMGYAEGALTCDRITNLFENYLLDHLVGHYTDFSYSIARTYINALSTYDDADRRELEAIVQGMNDTCTDEQLTAHHDTLLEEFGGSLRLGLDDILFANAVADFGCSSFTVWGEASSTGDTIHGRNFDWAVDAQGSFLSNHMVKVYRSDEDNGARWASLFVPALAGCISCVSDEGVALTMHNVGGLPATQNSGISPRMLAARAALVSTWEADDVVAAAEATLEARPQSVGNNLHLSFPTALGGGIGGVVLEYDGASDAPDGQVTVRRPGEDPSLDRTDAIVATNHYIKRTAPDTAGDSFDRSESLRADIRTAVGDGTGVSASLGRDMLGAIALGTDGLTAHSVVIDAANRRFDVYVGADPTQPAPDALPVEIDLDELFAGLPE